jgi:hypothetical protein
MINPKGRASIYGFVVGIGCRLALLIHFLQKILVPWFNCLLTLQMSFNANLIEPNKQTYFVLCKITEEKSYGSCVIKRVYHHNQPGNLRACYELEIYFGENPTFMYQQSKIDGSWSVIQKERPIDFSEDYLTGSRSWSCSAELRDGVCKIVPYDITFHRSSMDSRKGWSKGCTEIDSIIEIAKEAFKSIPDKSSIITELNPLNDLSHGCVIS